MFGALFDQAVAGRHEGRSAGSTPAEQVHPEVIAVMDELGLDLRAESRGCSRASTPSGPTSS